MSYLKKFAWLEKNKKQEKNNPTTIQKTESKNQIVLFDMDGTLTEPRKSFDNVLMPSISSLSRKSQIGIVTGSDLDYLQQQLKPILDSPSIRQKLHLLPCNGTKYYSPPSSPHAEFKLVSEVNMRQTLGSNAFKQIMIALIEQQSSIDLYGIPLTGHFISYRGSMINWCPIGRNANDEQRKRFVEYDLLSSPSYREKIIENLQISFDMRGVANLVTIKLGGSTSFDIYPKGWDKTYCLKHFQDWETWFVGDRCEENGNDKEIYDLLLKKGKAFQTKNTNNTRLIIDNIILSKL